MATYQEILEERIAEAKSFDEMIIQHFGQQAEDVGTWPSLWQQGQMEVLTNPTPTKGVTYKGLPVDEDGAVWWDIPSPNIYSKRFTYLLLQEIVHGGPQLIAFVDPIAGEADAISCDYLEKLTDDIETWLHSYSLKCIHGNGVCSTVSLPNGVDIDTFFKSWPVTESKSGVFVHKAGVFIPGKDAVPASIAIRALQVLRNQLEKRRVELTHEANPKPELENRISVRGIALIWIYENKPSITRENAKNIVSKYGYKSGEGLYQDYTGYLPAKERTGFDVDSKIQGKTMIKHIKSILSYLSTAARQKAEIEIRMIEARIASNA